MIGCPTVLSRASNACTSCGLIVAALIALTGGAVLPVNGVSAAEQARPPCPAWNEWQRFKHYYLSEDGRVVDSSTPQHVTVSEGQAYALFLSLVANDPAAFAKVLHWTHDNLAEGDLAGSLPAWQWGRAADGTWRVLDSNPAADADLWIAYALGEAGRLWRNAAHAALGREIAQRILREEVVLIPGLGATLLPGPKGFVQQGRWRLNASYVPIQVVRGVARQNVERLWQEVLKTSERMILASAPRGYASDWIEYRRPEGFATDSITQGVGSYNAIRVYLWAGMLPASDPLKPKLMRRLAPMMQSAAARAAPVETVDTNTLTLQGDGSPGFSAALLPMFATAGLDAALQAHYARVESEALQDGQSYYSDVLALFGLGWLQGRYRFESSGLLQVSWAQACRPLR